MQNRTDLVGVSTLDKIKQQLLGHKKWLVMLGTMAAGYVMSNSFLFGGAAPFGVALSAALPKKSSPCAAFGSMLGYLFSAGMPANIKYIAALVLVVAVKWMFGLKLDKLPAFAVPVLVSLGAMSISGFTIVLVLNDTLYGVIITVAEILLAGGASYFFARTISAAELGLNTASRSDLSCAVISFAIVVMGFETISIGGLSVGRILSVLIILVCARYGKEAGGAISGVTAGIAMGFSGGDYTYVTCAYSIGGLVAGIFGHVGRLAAAAAFVAVNTVTALVLPNIIDVYTALFEIFVASAIFMAIPGPWIARLRLYTPASASADSGATAQSALRDRLSGLSEALMDISKTTHQVSRQLGKLEDRSPETIYSQVADRVCVHCGMKTACWQFRYNDTMNAMNDCMQVLRRDGSINREKVPKHFTQTCCKLDEFLTELNIQFNGFVSKEGVQIKVSKVRSVVTDQFEGMSMMMDEIAGELSGIRLMEPQKTKRVREHLEKEGLSVKEVLCYTNEYDRITVEVTIPSFQLARMNKSKTALDLCGLLEAEFDLPQVSSRQTLSTIVFTEKSTFVVELGAYQIPCGTNRLCGDAYDYIRNQGGRAHLILSDGMGSGGSAAVDSAMATNLITRLITVGIGHEAALKMVNSALLIKSGEESLATIDICSLDLYTGKADFYKAGAAPTFLMRDTKVGHVESTSLPAGILRGVSFEKSSVTLHDGDAIIMVSDGVIATGVDWVKSELEQGAADMQRLCEKLANTAKMRRLDEREDDITVVAAALHKGI